MWQSLQAVLYNFPIHLELIQMEVNPWVVVLFSVYLEDICKNSSRKSTPLIKYFTPSCDVCAAHAHLRTSSPINAFNLINFEASVLVIAALNPAALSLTMPLIDITCFSQFFTISEIALASSAFMFTCLSKAILIN